MIIFIRRIVYSTNIADLKVIRYKVFTFDFGQKEVKEFFRLLTPFHSCLGRGIWRIVRASEKILATPLVRCNSTRSLDSCQSLVCSQLSMLASLRAIARRTGVIISRFSDERRQARSDRGAQESSACLQASEQGLRAGHPRHKRY